GGVVWRLSAGPAGISRPRRRVRFDETLEVTSLPVVEGGISLASSSIAFEESPADPSHRTWSAFRLVLLIVAVAGIGAGTIWVIARFLNEALASRLTGTP
ncbi:MAG: hypothetical protein WD770_04595, partial [Actinomycetota bacterium]